MRGPCGAPAVPIVITAMVTMVALSALSAIAAAAPLRYADPPVLAPPSSTGGSPLWSAAVDCAPPVALPALIGARVVFHFDVDLDGVADAVDSIGISPADCGDDGRIALRRRLAFAHPALLRAELRAPDDSLAATRFALTHGAGSLLRIERYCARPRNGEPEWIEVRNAGAHAIPLTSLRLEGRALAGTLAPGAGFTASADTAELRLWQPGAVATSLSSWSSLRNSGDTLRITWTGGGPTQTVTLDSVVYAAPSYPREDCASLAEDGSAAAAAGYRIVLPSGAWRRGDPDFVIDVDAPPAGRYTLRVLDLDGVPRCRLLRESTGPARVPLPPPRCEWLGPHGPARTVLLHVQPHGAPGVRRVLRVLP